MCDHLVYELFGEAECAGTAQSTVTAAESCQLVNPSFVSLRARPLDPAVDGCAMSQSTVQSRRICCLAVTRRASARGDQASFAMR